MRTRLSAFRRLSSRVLSAILRIISGLIRKSKPAVVMMTLLASCLLASQPQTASAATACGESGFTQINSGSMDGVTLTLYRKSVSGGLRVCAVIRRTTASGTIKVSIYDQNGNRRDDGSTTGSTTYAVHTRPLSYSSCGFQKVGTSFGSFSVGDASVCELRP